MTDMLKALIDIINEMPANAAYTFMYNANDTTHVVGDASSYDAAAFIMTLANIVSAKCADEPSRVSAYAALMSAVQAGFSNADTFSNSENLTHGPH